MSARVNAQKFGSGGGGGSIHDIRSLSNDFRFYRSVFDRYADSKQFKIINRENFHKGYDVPRATTDDFWSKYEDDMTFTNFQRLIDEQKGIDEKSLIDAFEVLCGIEKKPRSSTMGSSIDFNKFQTDLLQKGDRLNQNEFEKIRFLLGTEGGQVDYRKLAKSIGEQKNICRQTILTEEKQKKSEKPRSRPSSPTRSRPSSPTRSRPSSPTRSRPSSPTRSRRSSPTRSRTSSPTRSRTSSPTRNNVLITLPSSTNKLSIPKSFLHVENLNRGVYEIVPVTFGGVLKSRSKEINERNPIKTLKEPSSKTSSKHRFVMSKSYRDVLEAVFDMFDLDGNKQLDRQEYNLFTIRTAGEEIDDDDWRSLKETLNLDIEQNISKEKFLKLNEMEVDDSDTSESELWKGVKSLGFDYSLNADQMCPYNISVYTKNNPDLRIKPTAFFELEQLKGTLIKFYQKKNVKPIKMNNPDVSCSEYHDSYGSMLFAENKIVDNYL
ncbi:unnamed protein product [Didymodactylos carnosus]|uniref:EF-hand domain-containing protein n=1 Tax=Didymodactylos carnosus TaxID=1234261 RepID=A0A814H4L0_9BILA|nr:unnamed protein product [Didymodactylos carnosus]CAF3777079.1 unnamed protein product [Didymodactylos carnosus]